MRWSFILDRFKSDQWHHVAVDEKVSKELGGVFSNNIFEYMRLSENTRASQFENVILSGLISEFSTERIVRYLIGCAIKISTCNVYIIERQEFLSGLSSRLIRVSHALDFQFTIDCESQTDLCILRITTSELKRRFLSIHDRNDICTLVSQRMLSSTALLQMALKSAESNTGFSFIRLGHCENRMLGFGYSFGYSDAKTTYDIQFGYTVSPSQTRDISSKIFKSVNEATVLGVPKFSGFSTDSLKILDNATFIHLRDFSLLGNKNLCDVNIHINDFTSIAFGDFLKQARNVKVIGSRDISKQLKKSLGIDIIWIRIPAEYKYGGDNSPRPHYPDIFQEVLSELDRTLYPGEVYIVGAGILGKIYCEAIRSKGAVAIDIGSLMDAIAGLQTRGNGFPEIAWLK
jgi:hypothetical protein